MVRIFKLLSGLLVVIITSCVSGKSSCIPTGDWSRISGMVDIVEVIKFDKTKFYYSVTSEDKMVKKFSCSGEVECSRFGDDYFIVLNECTGFFIKKLKVVQSTSGETLLFDEIGFKGYKEKGPDNCGFKNIPVEQQKKTSY